MPDNCQPGTVRNYIKAALAGMVAGLCLALILNRFIWLEMRLTTGHAIPLLTAVFATAFGAARRQIRLVVFLLLELCRRHTLCRIYTGHTSPAHRARRPFQGRLSSWLPLPMADRYDFALPSGYGKPRVDSRRGSCAMGRYFKNIVKGGIFMGEYYETKDLEDFRISGSTRRRSGEKYFDYYGEAMKAGRLTEKEKSLIALGSRDYAEMPLLHRRRTRTTACLWAYPGKR